MRRQKKMRFKAPEKGVFCISAKNRHINHSLFNFSDSKSESIFVSVTTGEAANIIRYIYFESPQKRQSIASLITKSAEGFNELAFTINTSESKQENINAVLYNISLLKQYYKYIFILIDDTTFECSDIFARAAKCTIMYYESKGKTDRFTEYLRVNRLKHFSIPANAEISVEYIAFNLNRLVTASGISLGMKLFLTVSTLLVTVALIFSAQFLSVFDRSIQSFSEAPVEKSDHIFEYEFNGSETVYRIARHIVSKHVAWVADSADIRKYVLETLQKNSIITDSALSYMPKEATRLLFYPIADDSLLSYRNDSLREAYTFFTTIYGDSIAYLTDYWQSEENAAHRRHRAIDIGTSFDTYIFAPIDGHAHVRTDERGGKMITLYNDGFLITFGHCNKLLFFDNQDAYTGDVLATIGMSGNTSGPHAHIETGVRDSKGNIVYGKNRYKLIDPFVWHGLYTAYKQEEALKRVREQFVRDSLVRDSLLQDSIVKESAAKNSLKKDTGAVADTIKTPAVVRSPHSQLKSGLRHFKRPSGALVPPPKK